MRETMKNAQVMKYIHPFNENYIYIYIYIHIVEVYGSY